jgi:hypothetical protein
MSTMPKPVPSWEIFVYSTEMEGVHLRGGFIARGGNVVFTSPPMPGIMAMGARTSIVVRVATRTGRASSLALLFCS